jgi:hypothetical protein
MIILRKSWAPALAIPFTSGLPRIFSSIVADVLVQVFRVTIPLWTHSLWAVFYWYLECYSTLFVDQGRDGPRLVIWVAQRVIFLNWLKNLDWIRLDLLVDEKLVIFWPCEDRASIFGGELPFLFWLRPINLACIQLKLGLLASHQARAWSSYTRLTLLWKWSTHPLIFHFLDPRGWPLFGR